MNHYHFKNRGSHWDSHWELFKPNFQTLKKVQNLRKTTPPVNRRLATGLSLNILLSQSRSLKVIRNDTVQ